MACSGLKQSNVKLMNQSHNPTIKILDMALQINNYVKKVSWGTEGQKITLKMGIHYGKVIAGVIGHHKPQFSLIGDTINTTSRVTATGEANKVTISESVFDIISKNASEFILEMRKVQVKEILFILK